MKVSIVVDMENSSHADRRLVNELMPLMRTMTHNITILNQGELSPAPQQGLPAVSQEDRGQAPQQQGQLAAASLQRHPSHLSSQGSLPPAPDGVARPQGPQGLQQEQPTPGAGAGSGRLLPEFDAALYCPPALRDAAGPSGSPEMRRDPAFAPPQAHGPAKHVLPPPGFKQPRGQGAPQPDRPLRSAPQPEAEPRTVPQPELHDPRAPLAPAPRPSPPPLAPVQQPALQQEAPPVAIAAPVDDAPEEMLSPLAVKFVEALRRAIQSKEEATKELHMMMEKQKFTEVAWEHLTAAANLVIFDNELSRKRTSVHGFVDALMSFHDRKPQDLGVLLKKLLMRAWWILSPPQPFTNWQEFYPAMAFIVSCMRYTGQGGMPMPDVADTIAKHLLPEPNTALAGREMLAQLVTDEVTSKQFLARAPAGCLARLRTAVREHVLDKPGTERYSIMLKMHLAMTEQGLQPPKVWPDPEAVKPKDFDDFPLSVIMIAWRETEEGHGQQLMIGSAREEISLWNRHGLCEKRIKLEGHKPVHGIYSKDGKIGVAVVDISYGHDPNSALVVFNTEPPYSHVGPQLMIKLPEIEHCVALTTNIDQTLYIVGGNNGAKQGRVHSYIIDETSGVPSRQAGQMGRLASTTTICEVGFTLHSVTMFGMAKKKPVFIAGGGTPAKLEMWELQGKKPAQRLLLPDAAANRNSFVSSVACVEYHVVACSGTKVYQWNVRVKEALGGAKNPVRVLQLDAEAPARHIAFYSPFDGKECPFDSEHRPFLGAAISTESLLYYVVFKEDGSEPEGFEANINSYDDKDKMPLGAVAWAGRHPILYGGAANGSVLVFYLNP